MALETLSGNAPRFGADPIPSGLGQFGQQDAVRLMAAATPGMALVHRLSTDPNTYLDAFPFGHASGRSEFWGVLSTKGGAPTMVCPITTNNDATVSVLFDGYAPVLLAPGYVVRRGQFLEPIPTGDFQAHWRPVLSGGRGHAQALEDLDNSGGTVGGWVGARIMPVSTGALFELLTDSDTLANLAAETTFKQGAAVLGPIFPANTWSLQTIYRCRAKVRVPSGNGNDTLKIRARLGGLAGALLAQTPAVDVTNGGGDIAILDFTFHPRAPIGAAMPMEAAGLGGISPGQAVATGGNVQTTGTAATLPTVDGTAAAGLQLVITAEQSAANAANQAILEDFIVEQIA